MGENLGQDISAGQMEGGGWSCPGGSSMRSKYYLTFGSLATFVFGQWFVVPGVRALGDPALLFWFSYSSFTHLHGHSFIRSCTHLSVTDATDMGVGITKDAEGVGRGTNLGEIDAHSGGQYT